MPKVSTACYFEHDLFVRLTEHAKKVGKSRNQVISEAVVAWLDAQAKLHDDCDQPRDAKDQEAE